VRSRSSGLTLVEKLYKRRTHCIITINNKDFIRSEIEKAVMNMIKQNPSLKFWNFRIAILCLFAWYSFMVTSNAQWTTDTKKESQSQESKSDLKSMIQAPVNNVPPLEGPVDPDQYFVGPSDMLSVNIWISPPLNFSLTVTPEGTLIVPSVGEIRVTDMTLNEAKKKIIAGIRKKYLAGDPTVTLLNPRQISVTVTGAVRIPGKYVLYATDRVDKAVMMANKIPKDVLPESKVATIATGIRKDEAQEFEERNQSKRNIQLTRRTGEKFRADVLRYYATKDDRWNPLLREGDEIFVPRIDPKKNIFAIYGGVNIQGSFELMEGDSLLNAIELAYGFTQRAMRDSIMHYRYNVRAGGQTISYCNIDQIKQGSQENFVIIPGDRIVVKERPDVREDYHVFVDGEVRYPGTYPITKEDTKLSKVIEWAGGFTEFASLSAAEVIRSAVPPNEQPFERALNYRSSAMIEDSTSYRIESELRMIHEAVSVNFIDLFLKNDTTKDIVLQNGDWVRIPSVRKTVYVFGQVVTPGNVPFIQGERCKHYIEKAGGYTDNAKTGDVVIIKRATRQWLSPSDTEIEEGDCIWIPKVPERPSTYYWNIVGQMASIVSVAVSIVLLTIQLNK
jgi:polysaccharide export outer membrane protein